MMTVANLLTMLRILLIAPLLYTLQRGTLEGYGLSLAIFAAASITDYLDGKLARRLDQKTTFGEFLDPLADKLLVGGVFVTFAFIDKLSVPLWLVSVIVFREFFVTSMRVVALLQGKPIRTETAGKIKTAVQMFSITILLLLLLTGSMISRVQGLGIRGDAWEGAWISTVGKSGGSIVLYLPLFLVSLCGALALLSMGQYVVKNRHLFRSCHLFRKRHISRRPT